MRPMPIFAAFLTLIACGKDDPSDETDPEVGDPCDASFTMTTPDGTTVVMDECKHHGVIVEFATMTDVALPQPHNLAFVFRSTKDNTVNCWVRWDLEGACPDRSSYSLDSDRVSLSWNTTDCEVADSGKGQFEAVSGSSEFTMLRSQNLKGLAEGEPMQLEITAVVNAFADDGTTLSGTVAIDETVDLIYTQFASCSGSSGDFDLDGYDAVEFGGDDCDDTNPAIGPHANETCDEVDNNCDGQIDEGQTQTFYADADGDGWGADESAYEACDVLTGDVAQAGDCDDDDPQRYPNAEETCDGIDNDCDDKIDEGSQVGLYPDTDGDGFGDNMALPDLFCPGESPEGYSPSFDDCDDTDPAVNPDATEVCDGVDNDCDGDVDELAECK